MRTTPRPGCSPRIGRGGTRSISSVISAQMHGCCSRLLPGNSTWASKARASRPAGCLSPGVMKRVTVGSFRPLWATSLRRGRARCSWPSSQAASNGSSKSLVPREVWPVRRAWRLGAAQSDHDFDLDRTAARKRCHSDSRPGVSACVAEDLVKDPARTVYHCRLFVKIRRGSDVAGHRQDALNAVEGPERDFEHGESVERAHPRGLRTLGDVD